MKSKIITLKKHPETLEVDGPDGRIGMSEVLASSTLPSRTLHM